MGKACGAEEPVAVGHGPHATAGAQANVWRESRRWLLRFVHAGNAADGGLGDPEEFRHLGLAVAFVEEGFDFVDG